MSCVRLLASGAGARASLVTMNAGGYADVPGLSLLAW
jgi:hypothetical protein